jgi:hypothetical protein
VPSDDDEDDLLDALVDVLAVAAAVVLLLFAVFAIALCLALDADIELVSSFLLLLDMGGVQGCRSPLSDSILSVVIAIVLVAV